MKPVCHVVAGPNGSGKSTFALDYLPDFAGSIEYVNPDLLAHGLVDKLLFTRNGKPEIFSPVAARMRKDLGL